MVKPGEGENAYPSVPMKTRNRLGGRMMDGSTLPWINCCVIDWLTSATVVERDSIALVCGSVTIERAPKLAHRSNHSISDRFSLPSSRRDV
jgi:hypothetical protein